MIKMGKINRIDSKLISKLHAVTDKIDRKRLEELSKLGNIEDINKELLKDLQSYMEDHPDDSVALNSYIPKTGEECIMVVAESTGETAMAIRKKIDYKDGKLTWSYSS